MKNKGFSLVELIVVIAIMAILVGVAVPVYTSYIGKANAAKDEQLLGEINSAFMVAAVAEGVTDFTFAGEPENNKPAITVAEDGTIDIENMKPDYLADAMVEILGTDLEFSVIDGIWYNPNLRCFVESKMTFTFDGKEITVNAEDVAILSGDNAFSNRGSEALLDDVSVLENLLQTGIGEDVLTSVKQSDAFLWAIGGYAGLVQGAEETDDEYLDRVAGYVFNSENEDEVYSAQIMFAAIQAANITDTQLNALFTDGTVTSNIEVKNDAGETDYNATMANAALAYGMYTAYVQQYPNAENADNFTLAINSPEFATYYASAQGQADLEAYMAAMNMISDNTDNPEVTNSIMTNGIAGNQALEELMKEIMGN